MPKEEVYHFYSALNVRFAPPQFSPTGPIIPSNVDAFFVKAGNLVGNEAKHEFEEEVYNACHDIHIESPIEQLLFCALVTFARPGGAFGSYDPNGPNDRIIITPQKSIGRYRVDFEVQCHRQKKTGNTVESVLVECDSQAFHDRTEKERRAEKIRDRFLQVSGYKVFRFTGKEITENPLLVAAEIIAYVMGVKTESVYAWCEIYGHA